MTFKHVKFQDSAVMRSLEKVAREKGLVKEDDFIKNASAVDLAPTPILVVNLLKLSEGLRAKGFEKAALELENKTIAYKQAQTLYETSKEKGEDLVDAAHPKGSHKLEDVDGGDLAVFETILDQHLQNIKMIEKNPTGKLASSDEVMDAVRMVLGDSFLDKGRKVAQEASPEAAPTSSVGGDVAGTAAGMGGVSLLTYVFKKLKGSNALDTQTIKSVEEQMARKLTNAEADVIRKQVLERAGKQAIEKTFGAAAKEVTKDVAVAAVKNVGTGVAENVAIQGAGAVAKSSGAWTKLVGLLGSAGSTAAGIGATEIGGGTLTGGVAGLAGAGVAGAAALSAAALIGAIAGSIGGYYLFEHYYRPTELQEAGERLLSECKDVESDFPEYKHVINFSRTFKEILARYPVITKLKSGAPLNIESLNEMKQINDLILLSNKQASTIWGFAMGHKDDQWFGALRGFGDVVAICNNYMEVSMKMSDAFDAFAKDAYGTIQKKVQEESKQQVASGGGPDVIALQKSYEDTLAKIGEYVQRVKAKQLANAPALLAWLGKAQKAVSAESGKFKEVPEINRLAVVKDYVQRFEKFKTKVKAFEDKWLA